MFELIDMDLNAEFQHEIEQRDIESYKKDNQMKQTNQNKKIKK